MTVLTALICCVAFCAAVPACLFLFNLGRFRAPVTAVAAATGPAAAMFGSQRRVAVLIPARNEQDNIGNALTCVLASRGVELEVVVYDDSSADRTAEIVLAAAGQDARVRLVESIALPVGWNGKQHACWRLAEASAAPLMLFLDADVRLEADAIARCVAQLQASRVALLSGFPRLITKTWMEWLVLPLIQFVLLGFLPMRRMQRTTIPAYAAGCGQFMLAEREAYFASGGHAAIRETRHDGLRLPHLFREHGLRTDICDQTELASVRMYSSAVGVWNGLAKNATEGLGAPAKIVPLTLLLFTGQVLPAIFAVLCLGLLASVTVVGARFDEPQRIAACYALTGFALVCSYLPRLCSFNRFRQPLRSALLHPLGVLLLLAIQWYALARHLLGRPVGWRARSYAE